MAYTELVFPLPMFILVVIERPWGIAWYGTFLVLLCYTSGNIDISPSYIELVAVSGLSGGSFGDSYSGARL